MSDYYFLLRRALFNSLFVWVLQNASFLLPIKQIQETVELLAFHHPKPAYPFHIVLVPEKVIRSFTDRVPTEPFLVDLITVTQSLAAEYQLSAFRLIDNGGEYQAFPHLHFLIISRPSMHA